MMLGAITTADLPVWVIINLIVLDVVVALLLLNLIPRRRP